MARILLVDDDPTILALERVLLSKNGHQVLIANESKSAIDLLTLLAVDLIILDVMMPDLSGFQLVNLIKNSPQIQKTPVAFVTARNDEKSILRAAELGADFYVMKPIQAEDFVARVSNFFQKNPTKPHPKVVFEGRCMAEARIFRDVEILSISELGLEVRIRQEPEIDQVMEISSPVLREIPLNQPLMRVLSTHPDENGQHYALLGFAEIERETVRKIKNWISQKRVRRLAAG